MTLGPELIGPVLWDLVDRVAEHLSPQVPRIVHINPGLQVPWDDCCGGQLAGRVLSIRPIVGENSRGTAVPCGVMFWEAQLAISVVRCVATVNDQGVAPSTSQMDHDGIQMLLDQVVIQEVVRCDPRVRAIDRWAPTVNSGGCGGGEWQFTVRVDTCACAPELHQG